MREDLYLQAQRIAEAHARRAGVPMSNRMVFAVLASLRKREGRSDGSMSSRQPAAPWWDEDVNAWITAFWYTIRVPLDGCMSAEQEP
jgi:hypothetical protein